MFICVHKNHVTKETAKRIVINGFYLKKPDKAKFLLSMQKKFIRIICVNQYIRYREQTLSSSLRLEP